MTFRRKLLHSRKKLLDGLLVLTLSFLIFILCMNRELNIYDEGIVLFDASRILDGDVLHRDFYANYGPGQFYILAGLFKLFSQSVLIERIWDTILRSVVTLFIFLIIVRVSSRFHAFLASLFCAIWLASFGYYGYPIFPALGAALASLLCLQLVFEGSERAPMLVRAGLCVGLVALFRYDIGFFVFVGEALVLSVYVFSRVRELRHGLADALRTLLPFCLGVGAVALPVVAFYVAYGVTKDFVFDVLTFPARHYASMRSLPFPRRYALISDPSAVSVYLPLLLCAAAVPTVLEVGHMGGGQEAVHRPSNAVFLWTLATLMTLTLVFFAKGFVRVSVIHMAAAIVAAVALLAVLASRVRERSLFPRVFVVAGMVSAITCTLFALRDDVAEAKRNVAWFTRHDTWQAPSGLTRPQALCPTPAGLERLSCFSIDQRYIRTLQYLQARTKPGDYIYVGPQRHDRVVLNDVALYFLAQLRSVTKWHHVDAGLQTMAPIQQQIVAELRSKCPRFVVLDSRWDDMREPNSSAVSSGVTILDDYIHSHFNPVARFGTISILEAPLETPEYRIPFPLAGCEAKGGSEP